jgi:AraC-like DNA-binding protein
VTNPLAVAVSASTPTSDYRELAVGSALRQHFVCLWVQAIGAGQRSFPQRVLPDGCIDMVWIGEAEPVAVGPATRTFTADLPPGALVVGARFRPGSAPSLLRVPASAFLNRETPLRDVWGRATSELSARMVEAGSVEAKLAILEEALTERVMSGAPSDDLVGEAVGWLARRPAGRVHDLSRLLGLSSRQLQRRFRDAVGYGPKTLQRILRLQRVLALAEGQHGRACHLAALALEAGYADQAHMTREITELADVRPTRLLARSSTTLSLSDLFKTEAAAPA